MFQLDTDESVRLLNKLLDFVAISFSDGSSRVLALSIFSYSSEILEKRCRPRHERLRVRAAFFL